MEVIDVAHSLYLLRDGFAGGCLSQSDRRFVGVGPVDASAVGNKVNAST